MGTGIDGILLDSMYCVGFLYATSGLRRYLVSRRWTKFFGSDVSLFYTSFQLLNRFSIDEIKLITFSLAPWVLFRISSQNLYHKFETLLLTIWLNHSKL